MRKRWMMLLVGTWALILSGCGRTSALPYPVATLSDAQRTAIAAERPTLPPTFTPSPTWTPVASNTPIDTLETLGPTATFTLSPTVAPSNTPSLTPIPSATPTWTPDTGSIRPTQGTPAGPTPVEGSMVIVGGSSGSGCVGDNLLQNPSFDDASAPWPDVEGIAVPEYWSPFWKTEGTPITYDPDNTEGYQRPEMRVINGSVPFDNPPRVMDGIQALYVYGGNKVFDGGVYQQVTISIGDRLCLTGFAHAWSAHQSGDATTSRLLTDDDRKNMNFMLGIDPTGGTNAYSAQVVWSPTVHIYDSYEAIPPVLTESTHLLVTVFVRGYTMWRFDHNDMYFDAIKLTRTP